MLFGLGLSLKPVWSSCDPEKYLFLPVVFFSRRCVRYPEVSAQLNNVFRGCTLCILEHECEDTTDHRGGLLWVEGWQTRCILIHTAFGRTPQDFFSEQYISNTLDHHVHDYWLPLTSDNSSSLKWVTAIAVHNFLVAVSLTKQNSCCLASWIAKSSCLRASVFWGLGISFTFCWLAKPAEQNQNTVAPACCCWFGLEHATSVCVTQLWEQASMPCKLRRACILMLNVILGLLSFWQHFNCRPQFNTIIKCKMNAI